MLIHPAPDDGLEDSEINHAPEVVRPRSLAAELGDVPMPVQVSALGLVP